MQQSTLKQAIQACTTPVLFILCKHDYSRVQIMDALRTLPPEAASSVRFVGTPNLRRLQSIESDVSSIIHNTKEGTVLYITADPNWQPVLQANKHCSWHEYSEATRDNIALFAHNNRS